MRDLVAAEPHRADLQRDLSVSLNNLGNLARAEGDSAGARRFFEESLRVMRDLVAAEPHRADLRIDLAISYWNFFHLVTDRAEEIQYLELALETLAPLRERGREYAAREPLDGRHICPCRAQTAAIARSSFF